jgi:hypothetical protein
MCRHIDNLDFKLNQLAEFYAIYINNLSFGDIEAVMLNLLGTFLS